MIFSNMEYPGKDYRVLVYDSWLGEDFHSLDNPQDGDKIVYREMGEDGQPIVTKTEVYSNGEWAEEGSGGGGGAKTATVSITNSADTLMMIAPALLEIGEATYSVGAVGVVDGESSFTIFLDGDGTLLEFNEALIGTDIDVVVTDGDATVDQYNVTVTGDCSLTITTHT